MNHVRIIVSLYIVCTCWSGPLPKFESAQCLQAFVDLDVLTPAEVEAVLVTEFNPVRIAIGDTEIVTEDILNCGVHPKQLLEIVKNRFVAAGG